VGKPKAPTPPDPNVTAAAQTGTNVQTAIANATLGNVNQVGPDGSITYKQTGSKVVSDGRGGHYSVPTFTATTSLSAGNQAIRNQTQAAQLNLGGLANQQSAFLKKYMAKPVDLSNDAVEKRLFELGRKRLDPMFAERQNALDQKLANQGIAIGSKAYDTASRQFSEGQNDAYNQLLLQGHQQGVSDILAQRNQPINEITALLSGSQISNPTSAPTNMPTIPTVDYAGLVNENYNQRLGIYNQQQQQRQGILGGLFGLGGKLIGLA
jgi:hypothetical protein